MTGLVFHEDGHRYELDGKPIPGVTTALKVISADDYAFVDQALLEAKAARGRAVHRVIELDCLNQLMPDDIGADLLPYYEAWLDFLGRSGFEVILSEAKYPSRRYGYAGQLDLFGRLNGIPSLIDAKCVTQVMRSTGPQTAAYENLIRENRPDLLPPDAPCRRYALQLTPGEPDAPARWRLHPLTGAGDFKVFLSALTIHNFKRTK